jgi:hypothetical protein
MSNPINENLIRTAVSNEDWYLRIKHHYEALQALGKQDQDLGKQINEDLRNLFEELIDKNELVLGLKAPILDNSRKPVDTVVIHHTSQKPGLTLSRLNVIQLLNIYMPYYQNPTNKNEKGLKGQPITSNHLRHNKPVFWGYHWLLRMNGTAERLLPDSALGWHAANWDINCRSVGICLDNDYEKIDPSVNIIEILAELIRHHYPQVDYRRVFGHKEVSKVTTICPGTNFEKWKKLLLTKLR